MTIWWNTNEPTAVTHDTCPEDNLTTCTVGLTEHKMVYYIYSEKSVTVKLCVVHMISIH